MGKGDPWGTKQSQKQLVPPTFPPGRPNSSAMTSHHTELNDTRVLGGNSAIISLREEEIHMCVKMGKAKWKGTQTPHPVQIKFRNMPPD